MPDRREFLIQASAAAFSAATVSSTRALIAAPATSARQKGTVQTVLGPIDASRLGFTLPHEHICASSAGVLQTWPELFGGRAKFIEKVVGRLEAVKADGVDTIVDVTPADIGRDIRLLEEVSRKSGMQIVACTGHWLNPSLTMSARSAEELADFFTLEIERGLEGTSIKPGVIKVATDKEGVTPFLENALRAAARASKRTGVPVTTHTYASSRGGEKQAEIFESEGLSPNHVCLGHSDEIDDLDYLTGLAKRGYTLGMDHFTTAVVAENSKAPDILSWQKRAQCVKKLMDAGFTDRLFLSNDWYFGVSIAATGAMETLEQLNPDGMQFTTHRTIPYLKELGATDSQIRAITVDNPGRFLALRAS